MSNTNENTRWYNFNAGQFCGVMMPEHVMKKLAKLNAKYSDEVKRVLEENKADLRSSNWTCVGTNPQTTIQFVSKEGEQWNSIDNRIKLFTAPEPVYVEKLYFVENYDEAKAICVELHAEAVALQLAEEAKE